MDATNNISTDLFYKIRSRFTGLKLGEATGQITINPESARFFDFDYTESEKNIGHVSISLAEPNSMKVYFSTGITEGMDQDQKGNWYAFLKELRMFAKRRLLAFDTRDIAKDNLDKRDYAFLSQHSTPQSDNDTITKPVGEAVMNESNLYGTKTQSFQKLMDTRLIIKHSKKLADDFEQKPGDRSRNISALFVENQDGERFKYPFVHLAGARAMQRHVANGGLPYDAIGESIIKMSEDIAQLKSFTNYCVRNDLMNSDTNSIVERSKSKLEGLRVGVTRLSKQAHYENYVTEFQAPEAMEIPEDVMKEYTEKFTVKNFKEDIANAFPIIYKLMKEEETVGYDDIVAMTGMEDAFDKADRITDPKELNLNNPEEIEDASQLSAEELKDELEGDIYHLMNKASDDFTDNDHIADEMGDHFANMHLKADDKTLSCYSAMRDMIDADPADVYETGKKCLKILGAQEHEDEIQGKKGPRGRPAADAYAGGMESLDGFAKFEDWVNQLGEESPLTMADEEQKSDMVKKLNGMLNTEFQAGVEGINAIQSLEGIIEDPKLEQDIKKAGPEADVRPMVKAWVEENAPDVLAELDFGDMVDEPAAGAAEVEPQQEEGVTSNFMKDPSMGMNKYGLAAIQKDGMFFSIKDKKITGGPFDSIDELKKHQEELMNKDSDDDYKDTQPELKGGGSAFKGFKGKDPEADELNDIMKLSGESYSKTQEAGGYIGQMNDPIMFKGKEIDLDKLDYDMQDISDGIYELNAPVYYTDGTEVDDADMNDLYELPELNDYIMQDYMDRQAPQEGSVSEGGDAWDMALTGGMEIISNCDSEEECIKQLEAEITGGKDADDAYADMITKDYIEKIKKHGLEKVKRDVDAEDIMGEPVDLEGQETEGNEYGDKVSSLKAQGAKKGTKFKTSDGEEHTLEGLAEFIKSFYDGSTGTFPKGPEGVATMVGKKFGEQAEQVARKMVERMAPAQEQGAEDLEELERIKQLSKF